MLPEFLRNINERLRRKYAPGKIEQTIRYIDSRNRRQTFVELDSARDEQEANQVLLKFFQTSLQLVVSIKFLEASFFGLSANNRDKCNKDIGNIISSLDEAIEQSLSSLKSAGKWPSEEWLTKNLYLKVLQTVDKTEQVCMLPDPSLPSGFYETSTQIADVLRKHLSDKLTQIIK